MSISYDDNHCTTGTKFIYSNDIYVSFSLSLSLSLSISLVKSIGLNGLFSFGRLTRLRLGNLISKPEECCSREYVPPFICYQLVLKVFAQSARTVEYTPTNKCPGYDTKQSDGEVPVMLEFGELPLIPGSLWPGVEAPDRALFMG